MQLVFITKPQWLNFKLYAQEKFYTKKIAFLSKIHLKKNKVICYNANGI